VGGVVGGYLGNESSNNANANAANVKAAQEANQQAMNAAAGSYAAYRPDQQEAYLQAMTNQSTAYNPANTALGQLYGGGAGEAAFAPPPPGYAPVTRVPGSQRAPYQPTQQQARGALYNDPSLRNPPGLMERDIRQLGLPPASSLAPVVGSSKPAPAPQATAASAGASVFQNPTARDLFLNNSRPETSVRGRLPAASSLATTVGSRR
jgi:hypothetical protein